MLRKNPAGGSLLGVGKLVSLEVLDPKTGRSVVRGGSGRWLGWDVKRKTYVICTIKKSARHPEMMPGTGTSVAEAIRAHKKFHDAQPKSMTTVDAPDPKGRVVQIGLLKALTYSVPKSTKSPEKNRYFWHHAFGDTGHTGGSDYPQKVMPALMRDSKGNLFIKRRPGNIFTVDSWLRG